jgi:hypothetical protein
MAINNVVITTFVLCNIRYAKLEILCKVYISIKNVDFLELPFRKSSLKLFFHMVAPKSDFQTNHFLNGSHTVNFEPYQNTLEMDFQRIFNYCFWCTLVCSPSPISLIWYWCPCLDVLPFPSIFLGALVWFAIPSTTRLVL